MTRSYTYEMWEEDGRQVSIGLYETGGRPSNEVSSDLVPVRVRGKTLVLDADDLLLKAQSFFRRKYGQMPGDDFYLRWASVLTFCRENAERLATRSVVQLREGDMVGIDANFVRMLLDSYEPSPLIGGFPASPLHDGDAGFGLGRVLHAWASGKYFKPVPPDPAELRTPANP